MPTALDLQRRGLKFFHDQDGNLRVVGPDALIAEAIAESDKRIECVRAAGVGAGVSYTAPYGGYGKCEICGDVMPDYLAGCCWLCSRAIRRVMNL